MNNYRIRIDDVEGVNTPDLIEISQPKAYVIVKHVLPHGNPHYHAYIQTEVKDANFRKRLKAKFPQLTKTDYSVKKCDDDRINEYVQYLFNTKRGNRWELVDKYNFDDSVLSDCMESAQKVSDEHAAKFAKSKTNTGPTIWDLAQQVAEEYAKATVIGEDYDQKRIIAYTDIAIGVLLRNKKAFDEFLLRKLITTAMAEHPKGKEHLRYKMLKNFSMV